MEQQPSHIAAIAAVLWPSGGAAGLIIITGLLRRRRRAAVQAASSQWQQLSRAAPRFCLFAFAFDI